MSLITQCPACSTMFRVVPDQLRISEGWVRCGQCDEVFDANAHLRTQDDVPVLPSAGSAPPAGLPAHPEPEPEPPAEPEWQPVAEPPAVPAPEPWTEAVATAQEEVASAAPMSAPEAPSLPYGAPEPLPAYDWGPVLSPSRDSLPEITLDVGELPVADAPAWVPETDPFLEHSPLDSLAAGAAPDEGWVAQQEHEIAALRQSEAIEEQADAADMAPAAEEPALSFMAAGATAPVAPRGPGKAMLVLLCTLLFLLLGMQLLLSERDRLAATAPALRPLLSGACSLLGCAIAPPRQIDAIAIDSSAFTSVKPGVYLLKVTLKNAAAMDLATPALELTLTDTQDQPLLRRVVLPSEFHPKAAIAAGAELAASLPVSVRPGVVPERISGYKLLAFYP